jgi:hypothetical protein
MQAKYTPADFLTFLRDLDQNDETRDYKIGALGQTLPQMDPADFEEVLSLVDDLETQDELGKHGDVQAALAKAGIVDPQEQSLVLRGMRLLTVDDVADRLKGRSKPAKPAKPSSRDFVREAFERHSRGT